MKLRLVLMILAVSLLLLVQIASAGEFFLKQTIYEGETKSYDVGGYVYEVHLISVFDSQFKAQFEVNGEKTDALSEDESYKLSDGAVIQVRDVLPQEAGEGSDLVQFNLFPVAHPEAATKTVTANVTREAEPAIAPALQPTNASSKESKALPAQEAKVDITKKPPERSWWIRFIGWFKNLFK
ncbi:hypothetical protein JW898_06165 [Candidatus Woesearchaeota archaeon]|nr:hypothetical protein [Candidatus Woesearchaeota archaeon]